jgi:hypothetical protein
MYYEYNLYFLQISKYPLLQGHIFPSIAIKVFIK